MTTPSELPLWSLDTNIVSYIVRDDPGLGMPYQRVVEERLLVLTYFSQAELEAPEWSSDKLARLASFVSGCVPLDHPGDATRHWYVRASRVRTRLHLESSVQREDLWMIAQTAEYGLPLLSHDRNAVRVARALEIDVSGTLLDSERLQRLFDQDQRLLARNPLPVDDFEPPGRQQLR